MFDHTASFVSVPEDWAVQALPLARTSCLQEASLANYIMELVQLAAASVSSTLHNFLADRPYGNFASSPE